MASHVPVAMIDHGNAFDPEWNSSRFLPSHAFADAAAAWRNTAKRKAWSKKANAAIDLLPDFWDAMPSAWHENPHGENLHQLTLEKVHDVLHRFASDETGFWSSLLPT